MSIKLAHCWAPERRYPKEQPEAVHYSGYGVISSSSSLQSKAEKTNNNAKLLRLQGNNSGNERKKREREREFNEARKWPALLDGV